METSIKGKKRIAAYLRVSTLEQAKEGFGLKTQRHHIEALINANAYQDWELIEVYQDDGVSGSLLNRPALDRLMEDAKKGKFDMVVVWKIDRLFRDMKHLLATVELMGTLGVDFKSVTEPFDTSAVGQFIFQIFGALAEFERNLIRLRTMEGKMSAVRDGYYVGTNIPYGYQVVGEPKRRKLVLLPAEAKWVRKIFDWFVISRWTPEDIAAELTKRGVPGKKTGRNPNLANRHAKRTRPVTGTAIQSATSCKPRTISAITISAPIHGTRMANASKHRKEIGSLASVQLSLKNQTKLRSMPKLRSA